MNIALFSAACLTLVLGIAHSVLGEVLIFKRLRSSGSMSGGTRSDLAPRQWAALWATWHLVTLLAFGLAAILIHMSVNPSASFAGLKTVFIATFVVSALFWVYGTSGKHPAWIVFLIIAALVWWA